jgi:internalin A
MPHISRSDFERIHRDIRNLQPQAMVPVKNYPDALVPYEELLDWERNGIQAFPKIINRKVIELNVQQLLNGVDLEGARRREKTMEARDEALHVFISYAHKDETLRSELDTHLKLLQRQGVITVWHDRQIDAGDEWKREIDENLERADIILLLVSADFIASDYCYITEGKRALERHESKEARVIPIIIRNVDWGDTPFAKLQALPAEGRAVRLWPDSDSAWRSVAEGIKKVAKQIKDRKAGRT